MGLISLSIILIQFIIYKIFSIFGNITMKNKMLRVLAETVTTLALFNSLNIGFSTGIHFKYMKNIDVNNVL